MNIGLCGTPLYVWWNGTRMHVRTHIKKDMRGISGQDDYADGMLDHVFFFVPAQEYVGNFLGTFREFRPRQKAASFSLDQVMEQLQNSGGSKSLCDSYG